MGGRSDGLTGGRSWTSDEVAAALDVPAPNKTKFTGVATDTRQPMTDHLFVALKGEHFDAHDFLEKAKAQGAAAAVVRRGTQPVNGLPFFEVDWRAVDPAR